MRMPQDQNNPAHAQIFVGDESGGNARSVAFSKGEKVAAKPTDEDATRPKQSVSLGQRKNTP